MTYEEDLKDSILKHWDELDEFDKEYKQPFYAATDDFRRALIKEMFTLWDAGRAKGMDEGRNIVESVYQKHMLDCLEKNPKMTLKAYVKRLGLVE